MLVGGFLAAVGDLFQLLNFESFPQDDLTAGELVQLKAKPRVPLSGAKLRNPECHRVVKRIVLPDLSNPNVVLVELRKWRPEDAPPGALFDAFSQCIFHIVRWKLIVVSFCRT